MYSRTWDEHLEHLAMYYVLEVLQEESVYAKKSLCEFGMSENLYIGRIVFNGSVLIMMIKIQAMRQWPLPRTLTLSLFWDFMSLCSYYWTKDSSEVCWPDLTNKGAFAWPSLSRAAQQAFDKLKEVITSE